MKKKFSLWLNIVTICLCIFGIAIGVYAATSARLTVSGTIGFKAHDCTGTVYATMVGHAKTETGNPTTTPEVLTDSAVAFNDVNGIEFDDCYFSDMASTDGSVEPIVLSLTITNTSLYPIEVSVTLPTEQDYIYFDVDYEPMIIDAATISGGTVIGASKTISITMYIAQTEGFDLTSLNFTLNFKKIAEVVDATTLSTLSFTYDDDNMTASVAGADNTTSVISIPSYISNGDKKYIVSEIDPAAFKNYNKLETLILPETLIEMGHDAITGCSILGYTTYNGAKYLASANNPYFAMIGVTDTTITEFSSLHNDTKLLYRAFMNCQKLASVTLNNGLKSISNGAFVACVALCNVTIPNSVVNIGSYAFMQNKMLNNLVLPNNVKYIRTTALYFCTSLSNIKLSINTKRIDSAAFQQCSALQEIKVPNLVKVLDEHTFNKCGNLKNVVLPNGLTTIKKSAFYSCSKLESVNLPNTLTKIGEYAFYQCSNLNNITFSNTLNSIGAQAFRECLSIDSLILPDSVQEIGEHAFRKCTSLLSVKMPKNLTFIAAQTFRECTSLSNIILPENLQKIEQSAFNTCSSLISIEIPNTVTKFGAYCFSQCGKLKQVNFPTALKTIEQYALQQCELLEKISLPEGLEFIADGAFNHCPQITNNVIKIPSTIKQIGGLSYDPANPNTNIIGSHMFYDCATNNLTAFELADSNEYYTVVDGVLYRKNNGVPTVLVAYPSAKNSEVYDMPDTVVDGYEMAISRPINLNKIILSDSFVIRTNTEENILNRSWGNNLSVMLYVVHNITQIECNTTNPNYISHNGQVYSKDGSTLYYASVYTDLTGDSRRLTLDNGLDNIGITNISFGSIAADGILADIQGDIVYNEFVLPSTVTNIDSVSLSNINAQSWTISIEDGNSAYELNTSNKIVAKA